MPVNKLVPLRHMLGHTHQEHTVLKSTLWMERRSLSHTKRDLSDQEAFQEVIAIFGQYRKNSKAHYRSNLYDPPSKLHIKLFYHAAFVDMITYRPDKDRR